MFVCLYVCMYVLFVGFKNNQYRNYRSRATSSYIPYKFCLYENVPSCIIIVEYDICNHQPAARISACLWNNMDQ